MLLVEVLGGPDAETVAAQLRAMDSAGLVWVTTRPSQPACPSVAGLVVAAPSTLAASTPAEFETVADVILRDGEPLHDQVARLYRLRISAFAAVLAGQPQVSSAVVLRPYDARWASAAGRYLDRLRAALATVGASEGTKLEHIGSTAVPGLRAKAIVDLQMQVPELRHDAELDKALHSVGFCPAVGSRPDSPGVHRDIPRGSDSVMDHVWDKRLFMRPDPGQPSILHIRKEASPWARYTILFCDWLRQHPAERMRYQQTKSELAGAHAGDLDYDDYTRAKTAYFDDVQAQLDKYGREAAITPPFASPLTRRPRR
ncbi:MAG: GrpB family protein [Geodermatophilaceae bacterium]